MLEHDVPGQCARKGDYLIAGLKRLQEKYPGIIVDVRGIGLMIGVEFTSTEVGYSVAKGMFARRVLTAGTLVNAKCIRFEPAAVISYEDIDQVITRMDAALEDTRKEFNGF